VLQNEKTTYFQAVAKTSYHTIEQQNSHVSIVRKLGPRFHRFSSVATRRESSSVEACSRAAQLRPFVACGRTGSDGGSPPTSSAKAGSMPLELLCVKLWLEGRKVSATPPSSQVTRCQCRLQKPAGAHSVALPDALSVCLAGA
jgi:hypothetical protein